MKVTELREYKLKKGKTQEWLQWMKAEILPYQQSKGMKIISTYVQQDEEGNDYFIWLREFDNEAARQEITKLTYNDWWVNEIRPKVFELIEKDHMRIRLMNQVHL